MTDRKAKIVISAAFLAVFVALFLTRSTDDNSLFSWSWMFDRTNASRIYMLLLVGLVGSLFLSRSAFPPATHLPILAVLSFAVTVPLWQESELLIDASRYFTQAKHLELYGVVYFFKEWGREVMAWTDLPLVPFLYGVLFKLFGEHRIVIQIFTSCLFALTSVLTCLIGRALWDRESGFSAGLLLLGFPYLLLQVPLMLVDVPTMFFLTLSVYTFLSALTAAGVVRHAAAALSIACMVLAKYSTWLMLSILPVILLVYAFSSTPSQRRSLFMKGCGILIIATAIACLALALKKNVIAEQIALLMHYQKPGLARWSESLHSTFLFQIHPFITLFAVLSIVIAYRHRDPKQLIALWLVLLVLLGGVRRIRYTLPVFPMLALMAGHGLQAVTREGLRRFIVYGIVSSSLAVTFLAYLPFALHMSAENLKLAGEYLSSRKETVLDVRTLAPTEPVANQAVSVPLLDLFSSKQIRYCWTDDTPPPAGAETSSLRFTWEYRTPKYYTDQCDAKCNAAAVLVSTLPLQPLSGRTERELTGMKLVRTFEDRHDIFMLSFGVSVYEH